MQLKALWSWLVERRWRAAAAFTLAALLVAFSAYRAAALNTCDLVHGYLIPTRGILFGGKDPYVDYVFNSFSPFFYALLAPFALLPDWLASTLWSLTLLFFVAGALGFVRTLLAQGGSTKLVPGWVALALGLTLVLDNFFLGQSNLFSLFFVCAAVAMLHQRKDLAAGGLLAVAIAWKITPALFIFYFALKRRWLALAGAAGGLVVCLLLVPSLMFGPARTVTWLAEWSTLVLKPFASGEKVQTTNIGWYHTNQSMEAALNRHLTPYGRESYGGLHEAVDPASLDESQTRRIALGARLVLLALLAAVALRSKDVPLHLAVFLMAALFLSPASWYSHYVAVIVAYAVAAQRWTETRSRVLLGGLAAAVLLTSVSLNDQLRSYSLPFFGQVALFGARVWFGLRKRPAPVG